MIKLMPVAVVLLTCVWCPADTTPRCPPGLDASHGYQTRFELCRSGPGVFVLSTGDKDTPLLRTIVTGADVCEELPEVWIGVRVTHVPEALASHLHRSGLMIANVAEGSPADHAGLQRYDVVVSFDGRDIEEMDDLLEAIRDSGADNAATMVVISAGKDETLSITPIRRDETAVPTFKYDEPEAAAPDCYTKYFGHRLTPLPGGIWMMEPQGRMDALPDEIKELLEDMPHTDWRDWQEQSSEWAEKWSDWAEQWPKLHQERWRLRDLPFGMEIDIDMGLPDDREAEAEISVRVSEGGETIEIHCAPDGTIEIEREDADGNRSSSSYDSVEQLREEDPEAYEDYRRYVRPRGSSMMVLPPMLRNLGDKQHEFQIKLQHQLGDARKRVHQAIDGAREARKRVEIWTDSDDDGDVIARSKSVMIFVDVDGRITVEIDEGDVSKKYEFDSRDEFEDTEPELYERFRKHLDDADSDARSERIEMASARHVA